VGPRAGVFGGLQINDSLEGFVRCSHEKALKDEHWGKARSFKASLCMHVRTALSRERIDGRAG
jgi:hypothetical protein